MAIAIKVAERASAFRPLPFGDCVLDHGTNRPLVEVSWAEPDGASALRPAAIADVWLVRHRRVRIIRDYGMFDRRETPQYYPDVGQAR